MNKKRQQVLISRILLVIFLTMLIVQSFHTHEDESVEIECYDCLQHKCHGHISDNGSINNCLICQLSHIRYIYAESLKLSTLESIIINFDSDITKQPTFRAIIIPNLRAPPFM